MGTQRMIQQETRRLSYLLSKPKRHLSEKELKELSELISEQNKK